MADEKPQKKKQYIPHPDDKTLSESEYLSSDWHKGQMRLLRHRLIASGIIKTPAWHPFNP